MTFCTSGSSWTPVSSLAALLRDARVGLQPGALVDLEFANAAHHRDLRELLRGDLDHRPRPARATYVGVFKALLDAGFAPDIEAVVDERAGDDVLDAASPLLCAAGAGDAQADRHLNVARYVVSGRALDVAPTNATPPITVVACTNNDAQLAHNLLASPCLVDGRHEVLLYAGMTSAAEGLNRGIEEASNDVVVLVHQDVYLPGWWPAQLWAQWEAAAASGGPVVLGPPSACATATQIAPRSATSSARSDCLDANTATGRGRHRRRDAPRRATRHAPTIRSSCGLASLRRGLRPAGRVQGCAALYSTCPATTTPFAPAPISPTGSPRRSWRRSGSTKVRSSRHARRSSP